jgi:transposase-like protein
MYRAHQARNFLKNMSYKARNEVIKDANLNYQSKNEELSREAFERFKEK